jgi:DNA topoisomerase I
VNDPAVLPTMRALARSDNGLAALFCFTEAGSAWRPLHSHDVSAYVAAHADGHFTVKEFRTWNATVLMALLLAAADQPASARAVKTVINASVRGVADWLGDTPAVARGSYIDPRLITRYESDGRLDGVPAVAARLPADAGAESAVAALLAGTA